MVNDMDHAEPDVTRIELPRPDSDKAVVISSVLVAAFVVIAFANLTSYRVLPVYSTYLSVIWLAIVSFGLLMLFTVILQDGLRQFVVTTLAPFSNFHFAEAPHLEGEHVRMRFGYRLLDHEFVWLNIPISDVTAIDWRSGQATFLSGRDMDDWHVFVRYHQAGAVTWTEAGYREESSHMVGPACSRDHAEATARKLGSLLESAGVEMELSAGKSRFVMTETLAT